jgi:VanZ family protein
MVCLVRWVSWVDPINRAIGLSPINSINSINPTNSRNLVAAGIIALVVAIADEIHQAYLPNRDASIIDVFLDIIGIILCMLIIKRIEHRSGFLKLKGLLHRTK